jgi:hypothetical protein
MQGRVFYYASEKNLQAGYSRHVTLENAAQGIYMIRMSGKGLQKISRISVTN